MKQAVSFVFPIVMLLGLVVSAFVIVTALQAAPSATNPGLPSDMVAMRGGVDQVANGRALFIAKGCAVCHLNERAFNSSPESMGFMPGPNLTTNKFEAGYLRRWLRDPAAIKPATEMPDLELSDAEIDALVAFLVAGTE